MTSRMSEARSPSAAPAVDAPGRAAGRARSRPRLLLATSLAAVAVGFLILWWLLSIQPSVTDRATQTAISYARQEVVWSSGPHIKSARVVRADELETVLRREVPGRVQRDVNGGDLVRRFGGRRPLDLVILSGTYNSLPPDEGVSVTGDVVVLVDVRQNRVVSLTV